jgi:hypothetical protein
MLPFDPASFRLPCGLFIGGRPHAALPMADAVRAMPPLRAFGAHEVRGARAQGTRHGMPCRALQTAASALRGGQFTLCALPPRAAMAPSHKVLNDTARP